MSSVLTVLKDRVISSPDQLSMIARKAIRLKIKRFKAFDLVVQKKKKRTRKNILRINEQNIISTFFFHFELRHSCDTYIWSSKCHFMEQQSIVFFSFCKPFILH
jgi:hypothetical protein